MKVNPIKLIAMLLGIVSTPGLYAQGTNAFTYQGLLTDAAEPANNIYDFQFKVFDSASGGLQQGSTLTRGDIGVSNGLFTVTLDFGASVLNGSARWLQIEVRPGASGGGYDILTPRQMLTPTPYALYAAGADAGNLSGTLPPSSLDPTVGVWTTSGNDVYRSSGRVGVGTSAPESSLDVRGTITSQFGSGNNDNIALEKTAAVSPSNNRFVLSHRTSGTELWMYSYDGSTFHNLQEWDHANYSVNFPVNGSTLHLDLGNSLVGIGTTDPEDLLHIFGGSAGAVTAQSNARLVIEDDTSAYINLLTPAANERGVLFGDPTSNSKGGVIFNNSGTPDGLQFRTGGNATRMVINSAGIVGVGTTSPYASVAMTLQGVGGNSGWLQFRTSGGVDEWHVNYENGGLNFVESGVAANRLFLEPGGDVGIGTSSPQERLHVAGNAHIDGTITIPTTTRYLSLSAGGFSAYGNINVYPAGGDPVDCPIILWDTAGSSQDSWATERVNLPDGAIVTQLEAAVSDSDPGAEISVKLSRASSTGISTTGTAMASLSTAATPGQTTLSTTSISNATINNQNYTYYLVVEWPTTGFSNTHRQFYKARITYTVTTPLH